MVKLRNKKRLTQSQKDRVRRYLSEMKLKWRFARSMPQWPHWYVLREWGDTRKFDGLEKVIESCGYHDAFGNRVDSYLLIAGFKYWILDDVLNRAAPISNAEMRRRGERWLRRHGKIVGPYGRPISASTRPLGRKRK